MDITIAAADFLRGEIVVPPSKSYGQRALAAALLLDEIEIRGLGSSDDELAAMSILLSCGCEIVKKENRIWIENKFDFQTNLTIDCNESGLSARLFSAFLALNEGETNIIGRGSLLARAMYPLADFYRQIGVSYQWDDGRLPLKIKGNKVHKSVQIDGSESSQYITGILYYIVGLKSDFPIFLEIKNLVSRPYIEMTVDMLRKVGVTIEWVNPYSIGIYPSPISKANLQIEGDWSSAAFWMVAAAINGDISFRNLNLSSFQADRAILEILIEIGAGVEINSDSIRVYRKEILRGFDFDATHCPDLIPILTILAFFSQNESRILGIDRLRNKESDRAKAIFQEISKLSDRIKIIDNILIMSEKQESRTVKNLVLDGYRDHRMVMAWTILALNLHHANTVIQGTSCVSKSYPDFFLDMEKLYVKK